MASLSNINGIFDVHSTGAILFSTSHGTSGQILKSNGNAAPTWIPQSDIVGDYLPLSGGTLTGATATASGISFTVGGALTGTTATFAGSVTTSGDIINTSNNFKIKGAGDVEIHIDDDNNNLSNFVIKNGTNDSIFNLAEDGNATFAGRIDINGSPVATGDTRAELSIDENNSASAGRGGGLTFGRQGNVYGGIKTLQNTSSNDNATMYFQTIGGGTVSNRMVIDELGNVGIGTTSPTTTLSVQGTTNNGINVIGVGTTATRVFAGLNSSNHGYLFATGSSGQSPSLINSAGGNSYISGGNVGIGTTSPSNKLDVFAANNFEGIALTDSDETLWNILKSGSSVNTSYFNMFSEGVTKVRIHADNVSYFNGGNVGIGTTSPSGKLHVQATSGDGLKIITSDISTIKMGSTTGTTSYWGFATTNLVASDFGIYQSNSVGGDPITSGTPRLYFNSSGNVGIGTTAPNNLLNLSRNVANGDVAAYIQNFNADTGSTNETASLKFAHGNDGVVGYVGGKLVCGKEGDFETSIANIKGNLQFYTASGTSLDSDVNNIERMRITSGGDLLVGTTGIPNGTSIYGAAFVPLADDRVSLLTSTSATTAQTLIAFYNPNGQIGTIRTSGSSTSYNTSSDYRLKEDLQDFNGLDKVSKIPVYDFKWKTDESRSYGVMAHELQEVLPDAVTGEKDAEEMQGVDYSKIVPLLVGAIQELKAEIEILKNK